MKKTLVLGALAISVAEIAMAIGGKTVHADASRDTRLYPMTAIITDLDYDNDIVTVTDSNGNDWQFDGCEDYFEGDFVSMVMYDAGKPDYIYDDEIVSTRYAGYWADGGVVYAIDADGNMYNAGSICQ